MKQAPTNPHKALQAPERASRVKDTSKTTTSRQDYIPTQDVINEKFGRLSPSGKRLAVMAIDTYEAFPETWPIFDVLIENGKDTEIWDLILILNRLAVLLQGSVREPVLQTSTETGV